MGSIRDLTRQCPNHGVSDHEVLQIFYDGLGAPDRYFLNTVIGVTFMHNHEDTSRQLIETVVENSHRHAAKSYGDRGITSRPRSMLETKAVEQGILLERLDRMAEVQNLLLNKLKIKNGSEGLAPATHDEMADCAPYSSFEHVEIECPVMPVYGQGAPPHGSPYQPGRAPHSMQANYNNPGYYISSPHQLSGFGRNLPQSFEVVQPSSHPQPGQDRMGGARAAYFAPP